VEGKGHRKDQQGEELHKLPTPKKNRVALITVETSNLLHRKLNKFRKQLAKFQIFFVKRKPLRSAVACDM
jgi:hypothetical protein